MFPAASTSRPVLTIALRDGSPVVIGPATTDDAREVEAVIARAGEPRRRFIAALMRQLGVDGVVVILARSLNRGEVWAVGGLCADGDDSATMACVVHPDHRDLGLGTHLLRALAARARAEGIRFASVDLYPGSAPTADVLRDSGLRTHWDLSYPVAHIELDLEGSRPGWRTPELEPFDYVAVGEATRSGSVRADQAAL
jgi:GNAT superfamily N-acetyltransferase